LASANVDGSSLVSWLDPWVGGHLAPSLHLLHEQNELTQWRCHDDIVISIIIFSSLLSVVFMVTCFTTVHH